MSKKRSRRRFLTDLACGGGALVGAALLAPRPFFSQFLERQDQPEETAGPVEYPAPVETPAPPKPGPSEVTEAYPSDSDTHDPRTIVTQAYPSDSDTHDPRLNVTKAYPSDSDMDDFRPEVAPKKEDLQSLQPFFQRLLS